MTDIPFDRSLTFEYGRVDWLSPRLRRIVANNPGPFTFTGTNAYIVGVGTVAVIDPGPDDPRQLEALVAALSGETVSHIIVTHTHRDHSPLARQLKAIKGGVLVGEGPHRPSRPPRPGDPGMMDAAADMDFEPDLRVAHGDTLRGDGWTLEAISTPGHTANHMAFAFAEEAALFSGDHVMAWSTSVIAPPDGAMAPYIASLRTLMARPETTYWPGHGGPVLNARSFTGAYLKHRQMREGAIMVRLASRPHTISDLVDALYQGLDPRLKPAAAFSVLAHLDALEDAGRVTLEGDVGLTGVWTATST
jgi:glyoxylase-like metal-dependent hydrolase (beta-lactamase superfamily II)